MSFEINWPCRGRYVYFRENFRFRRSTAENPFKKEGIASSKALVGGCVYDAVDATVGVCE